MDKYQNYITFDEPIPYKDLLIYPVIMRKYPLFMQVAPILLLDIYSMPDPKILSMKYLEYLFHAHDDENDYLLVLRYLLHMVLHLDNDEGIDFFNPEGDVFFKVRGVLYDKHDFEEVRNIIISQNLLKPPNYKIEKSLRDSMEESRRLKAAMGGNKTASIEEQMIALMTTTAMKMDDIYNLTIRKFSKALERVDNTLHYKIYRTAEMSGMVTFKDKSFIKHWLVDLSSNELDELVSYSSIESNVTKGNL